MPRFVQILIVGLIVVGIGGCGDGEGGGKAKDKKGAAGGGGPGVGGGGGGGGAGAAGGGGMMGGGAGGMMPQGLGQGGAAGQATAASNHKELFQYIPENLNIAAGASIATLADKSNPVGAQLLSQFEPVTTMLARAGIKAEQIDHLWSGTNRESGDVVICVRTRAKYDAAAVTKGLGATGQGEKVNKATVHNLPTNVTLKNAVAFIDSTTLLVGRYDTIVAALGDPKPGAVRFGLDALNEPDAYYWLAGEDKTTESTATMRFSGAGVEALEAFAAELSKPRGFAVGFKGGGSQGGGGAGGGPGGMMPGGAGGGAGGPGGMGPGGPGGMGPGGPGGGPGGGGARPGGGAGGPPGGAPGGAAGGAPGGGPPGGAPGGPPGGGGIPGGGPMPPTGGGAGAGAPNPGAGGNAAGGTSTKPMVDLIIALSFATEGQATNMENKLNELVKAGQSTGNASGPGGMGPGGPGGMGPGGPGGMGPGGPGGMGPGGPGGMGPGGPGGMGPGGPGGMGPGGPGGKGPAGGGGKRGGGKRASIDDRPPGAAGFISAFLQVPPGGAPGGGPGGGPPGGAPGGAGGPGGPGGMGPGGPGGMGPGGPGGMGPGGPGGMGGGQAGQGTRQTIGTISVSRDKENLRMLFHLPATGVPLVAGLLNEAINATGASALSDGLFEGTLPLLAKGLQQWPVAKPETLKGARRVADMPVYMGWSWMTELLPYVGHGDLYNQFDFSKAWRDKVNVEHCYTVIPAFLNPADPRSHWKGLPYSGMALSHFAGMSGIEDRRNVVAAELPRSDPRAGIFGYDEIAKLSDITDGTAQTIMIVGTGETPAPWMHGGGGTVRGARQPYFDKYTGLGSHGMSKPGTFVLFADGSSRFISAEIDPEIFKAMCTMHGAEQIDMQKLALQGQ